MLIIPLYLDQSWETGHGQGNCHLTRRAAEEARGDWIVTDPTASGAIDYIIMGDLRW